MTEPYRNTFGQSVRQGLSRLLGATLYQSPYGTYQTIANGFNPSAGWSESQSLASSMMNSEQADYNSYMRNLLRNDEGYTGESPSQPSASRNPFSAFFSQRSAALPQYASNYQSVQPGNYLQGNTAWGQAIAPSWNMGDTLGTIENYTGPTSNPYIGNGQGAMRAPTNNRAVGGSMTSRSPYGMVIEGEAARDMFRGMQGPSHRASTGTTTNQTGSTFTHSR